MEPPLNKSSKLPGEEMIEEGLQDLSKNQTSSAALLVLIGAPRLRRMGVRIPPQKEPLLHPEHALYQMFQNENPKTAHSRYNALIRRLVSYERALERCKKMEKPLPAFLKRYFWDTDFDRLDPRIHSKEVVGRILENGNEEAILWMKANYTKEEIAEVLTRYRSVSPKSASFWATLLDLPREKILCLQKPYRETQRRHWPY